MYRPFPWPINRRTGWGRRPPYAKVRARMERVLPTDGSAAFDRTRRAGLVLALVIAVPRLVLLLAGPDAQLSLLVDDASYYLEAARRVVESGIWPSMDGRNPTNGFHPLYMTLLVLAQRVAGTEPRLVIPLVTGIHLALNGIAAWMVGKVALRQVPGRAGWAAALLLALAPGWLAHGTLGVENSLSSLLLLVLVLRWDSRFSDPAAAHDRPIPWLIDGLLLGLAMLARTDAAIWGMVLLGWELWRSGIGNRRAWARAVGTGVVALVVVLPWLVVCVARFGTIVQDSSAALAARYDVEYGPRLSFGSFRTGVMHLGFWIFRLLWATGLVPLTGWVLGRAFAPGSERSRPAAWGGWITAVLCAVSLLLRANDPTDIRDIRVAAIELALGAAGVVIGLVSGPPRGMRREPVFAMLLVATGCIMVAYSFVFRGFQVWYSTGPCLAFALFVFARTAGFALAGRGRLAAALVVVMAVQSVLVVGALRSRGGIEGMHPRLIAEGTRLRDRLIELSAREQTPVRVGSFDSGELSYRLHPFPVANLDGVMNHRASVALRNRSLADYLAADGITHILSGSDRVNQFRRVSPFEVVPDSAWSAALGTEVLRIVSGPRAATR